ncbi:MAG: tetratricopeptide repeat protein, partial [Candidatus Methylumidiphilus sp.]
MKRSELNIRFYRPRNGQTASWAALAKMRQAAAAHQAGDAALAEALYQDVLQMQPGSADALHFLGILAVQSGNAERGIGLIGKSIALNPGNPEAHSNMGVVLKQAGHLEDALASFQSAVGLKPDYAEALYNCGATQQALGRAQDALDSYGRLLSAKPDHLEARINQGVVLIELGCFAEALASFDDALRLKPGHVNALGNRGAALQALNRQEEAVASYDAALRLHPGHVGTLVQRAMALQALRRFDDALAGYAHALRLQPDFAEAHFGEALARLTLGDFARGWKKYEWRWEVQGFNSPKRRFAQPLWLGREPLRGKTLLLHAEQGLGDTLQFCRYTKRAAAQGATVLLEVQPALKTLLAELEGVARVLARGEPLPEFDCHCPLMSLPLAFGADLDSIPAQAHYLKADPRGALAWQARLGEKSSPRIGLAWSG